MVLQMLRPSVCPSGQGFMCFPGMQVFQGSAAFAQLRCGYLSLFAHVRNLVSKQSQSGTQTSRFLLLGFRREGFRFVGSASDMM